MLPAIQPQRGLEKPIRRKLAAERQRRGPLRLAAASARRASSPAQRRVHPRVAIADTLGAASAIAHYSPWNDPPPVPEGRPHFRHSTNRWWSRPASRPLALAPLSVAALRLPAETCRLLADLGIRRIEQVAALPAPRPCCSRFGPRVSSTARSGHGASRRSHCRLRGGGGIGIRVAFRTSRQSTGHHRARAFATDRPRVPGGCREQRGNIALRCRFEQSAARRINSSWDCIAPVPWAGTWKNWRN